MSAKLGPDEQVFEMQAAALPGGVDGEEEGEAGGCAAVCGFVLGDQALVVALGAEAVLGATGLSVIWTECGSRSYVASS